jgi:hypothetical protein
MKAVIDVEGKKAIVNTRTDTTILEVGDRAGTDRWHDSTRGTNLMAHVSKNKRTAGARSHVQELKVPCVIVMHDDCSGGGDIAWIENPFRARIVLL